MRRLPTLAASGLVLAVALAWAPPAIAEPIGGPQLAGSDVIVDPGPNASDLPDVPVSTWVLADMDTGAILAAKGPHVQRQPASVLKTLTALTLTQRLDPQYVYTTTYDDVAVEGSRVGLVEDATYSVRDLFFGLFMQSGNDCASALANANGGFELTVSQMNDEAQRLQAYDTVATNPSGLPDEQQVSSAYDLALIAREGLSRPDYFEYANTRVIEDYPGYMPDKPGDPRPTMAIATQNPLFIQGYPGAIGLKTGWTTEAGRTFVGAAKQGDTTLVVTLMNVDGEIYDSAAALLDWGFANVSDVTPVGYLVDPVSPMIDAAKPPTDGAESPTVPDQGAAETASDATAAASAPAPGWNIGGLIVCLLGIVLGLLLIGVGVQALRSPTTRSRRAPSQDRDDLPQTVS
ncbi:MAG: D-alanyl-D-alanine carboxypeptidase family protein [Candidatus Nanopelagicales bacterium]